MAETSRRSFYEVEMKKLMKKIPQRILVPTIPTLMFAVGFIVGADPVNEIPVIIRQAGFLAFTFSLLCCVAPICVYLNLRSKFVPPLPWKLSLSSFGLSLAALTLVIGIYAVLTHYSSYTRIWISVTVVSVVCFPILTYVFYARAVELSASIVIAPLLELLSLNRQSNTSYSDGDLESDH